MEPITLRKNPSSRLSVHRYWLHPLILLECKPSLHALTAAGATTRAPYPQLLGELLATFQERVKILSGNSDGHGHAATLSDAQRTIFALLPQRDCITLISTTVSADYAEQLLHGHVTSNLTINVGVTWSLATSHGRKQAALITCRIILCLLEKGSWVENLWHSGTPSRVNRGSDDSGSDKK